MMETSTIPEVVFTIPGEPCGKGRPRFVRQTGRTYTPEKTARYENLVSLEYQAQSGTRFSDDAMLDMMVTAFYCRRAEWRCISRRRSNRGVRSKEVLLRRAASSRINQEDRA